MKTPRLALLSLAVCASLQAAPLDRALVPATALWVLHFDAEAFRATKLGASQTARSLQEVAAKEQGKKNGYDFSPLIQSVRSATLYGTSYDPEAKGQGVLLVRAGEAELEDFVGHLARHSSRPPWSSIKPVRVGDQPVFLLQHLVYAAPLRGGFLVLGLARDPVLAAVEVAGGREPALGAGRTFAELDDAAAGQFLTGGARELKLPTPENATFLRRVRGVRMAAGERSERLFLSLAFSAPDAATAAHLKQLVEGLVSWAALEKAADRDVQFLVQSAKTGVTGTNATLEVEYPLALAIEKAGQEHKKRRR